MDPNAALIAIRNAREEGNRALAAAQTIGNGMGKEAAAADCFNALADLIDAVDALDGWMVKGGFLPDLWRTHR